MAVFVLMAAVAIATGAGTTGPWFSAGLSGQVYQTSIIAAVLTAFALAAFAATHVARLEDARRSIVLRIASMPEAELLPDSDMHAATAEAIKMMPPTDEEVDELLTTLATPMPGAPAGSEIELTGALVEVSAALTAARTRKGLLKALLIERARVEAARGRVLPTVAGPIAMCMLFAFAAGAMLPGSEGFAVAHFQLNTALILFLAYGWAFLAAWAAFAFASLVGRPPESETVGTSRERPTRSRLR